jgi:hypothetical protein
MRTVEQGEYSARLVKVLCAGLSLAYAAHKLESRKRQEASKAVPEPIDRSNSACGGE